MRQLRQMLAGAVVVLAAGCGPKVDVAGETKALLQRDQEWARLASAGSADSLLAYWTDDARVVMPSQPMFQGKSAIRQMVMNNMATPGFHITWSPEAAVVSQSGDLGYTYGTNEVTVPVRPGTTMKLPGRYLTVWRKDADGVWRCVMDYSTPVEPPPAATPAAAPAAAKRKT